MHLLGFHHLAVQVRDLARVLPFYRDVLGLPERARHLREDGSVRSIWLDVPGSGFLALEETREPPGDTPFRDPRPGWFLLALRIRPEDRAAVEVHLARHQVEVVHRTRWTLYVRDPEGNRIGLSHHPDEAPAPSGAGAPTS